MSPGGMMLNIFAEESEKQQLILQATAACKVSCFHASILSVFINHVLLSLGKKLTR